MKDYRAELRRVRAELAALNEARDAKFEEREELIRLAKEYGLQTSLIVEDSGVTQQRISQILQGAQTT